MTSRAMVCSDTAERGASDAPHSARVGSGSAPARHAAAAVHVRQRKQRNIFVRYLRRLQLPPGLTGLWQISSRSNGDLDVKRAEDCLYIKNRSLWLDLYILPATLLAVIRSMGAKEFRAGALIPERLGHLLSASEDASFAIAGLVACAGPWTLRLAIG